MPVSPLRLAPLLAAAALLAGCASSKPAPASDREAPPAGQVEARDVAPRIGVAASFEVPPDSLDPDSPFAFDGTVAPAGAEDAAVVDPDQIVVARYDERGDYVVYDEAGAPAAATAQPYADDFDPYYGYDYDYGGYAASYYRYGHPDFYYSPYGYYRPYRSYRPYLRFGWTSAWAHRYQWSRYCRYRYYDPYYAYDPYYYDPYFYGYDPYFYGGGIYIAVGYGYGYGGYGGYSSGYHSG